MTRLIVLASFYDFTDERTGRQISGCKLTYLSRVASSATRVGLQAVTISGPAELFGLLDVVPGWYEIEVAERPDQQGRALLVAESARFVGYANMDEIVPASEMVSGAK
ncbi:MAG: hypothetical protein ACYC3W_10270 [Candidatus Nanopelagicales bacterium]